RPESTFGLCDEVGFERVATTNRDINGLAGNLASRGCRFEKLAQRKTRTFPKKVSLANRALRPRNSKRFRPARESRLYCDEPGPRRLRDTPSVLSIHRIPLLILEFLKCKGGGAPGGTPL